jgi:TRAP-type C4-dicarboxylate transport system substrate-binding protein
LAEKLLQKEVIFKDDLVEIFGERPWDALEPEEQLKEAAKEAEEEKQHHSEQQENESNPSADSSNEPEEKDPNKVDY